MPSSISLRSFDAKHRAVRRPMLAAVALTAALGLTGCGPSDSLNTGLNGTTDAPTTLIASAAYVRTDDQAQARLASLQQAIDDLRDSTGSGWLGRQDDVTGYLAELSGGRYFAEPGDDATAVIASLIGTYGQDLFGVTITDLLLENEGTPTVTGSSTIRATQQLDGVPVLDGALVFTIGEAADEPRINAVRGRVFPDLAVATTPGLKAANAGKRAERLSGGQIQGKPSLTVLPDGAGVLAWQVAIAGSAATNAGVSRGDGNYFLDATTGALIDVRPLTAEARAYAAAYSSKYTAKLGQLRGAVETGEVVTVTGVGPTGQPIEAIGLRTAKGVKLIDTTVPTYDPATGEGGIYTYDAQDTANLPGQIYTQPGGTEITDPEALAAQAMSRVVYDYYASLGRASWDGQGASLISTVHSEYEDAQCNAFFSSGLQPPQMVYGNQCVVDGTPLDTTVLAIDIAGHEITHGVTATSAGLIYAGQSGALNESFSDYFGNVIGNAYSGSETAQLGEDGCAGLTEPTVICAADPDGGLSQRYMLNGNTMDDYLFVLNPTLRLTQLDVDSQDQGGVHLNSSIWNNALWSIRSRLAQIDGVSANDSPRAQNFDKIVYAALTTQVGPSSGFLDASRAIVQTALDAGADSVILDAIRETFDFNKICEGCATTGAGPGQIISNSASTQLEPAVHGDQVTWIDLSQGDGAFGFPAASGLNGTPSNLATTPESAQVAFAGDAVIALEFPNGQIPGSVVSYDGSGAVTDLGRADYSTLLAGLAGSDVGAAWSSAEDGTISFVDAAGSVTTENLPDLGGNDVTAMGTGDGVVGMGTGDGLVLLWRPGGGFSEVGQMNGAVLAAAAYGDRVLAVDESGQATLFDAAGNRTELSSEAMPFGAALNDGYAVWVNQLGALGGGVASSEGAELPDTDLYLYSMSSGVTYDLLPERGQQGFPAMSGDRIVWQDSVFGGDDILTAQIPSGL